MELSRGHARRPTYRKSSASALAGPPKPGPPAGLQGPTRPRGPRFGARNLPPGIEVWSRKPGDWSPKPADWPKPGRPVVDPRGVRDRFRCFFATNPPFYFMALSGTPPNVSGPGHTMPGATPQPPTPLMSFERLGIRYGLWVGVAYIAFFLLMKALGLHERTEVAYVNGLFLIGGIILALREFKRATHNRVDYLPGLGVGFLTSLVSSAILALFFIAYSSFDKEFASHVMTANLYGIQLSVLMIFLVILLHGTVAGTFVGFIAMQFFKRPDHQMEDDQDG